jgi:hypothetical protein
MAFRKANKSFVYSDKLGSFFKPAFLCSKTGATSVCSIDE